MFNSISWQDFLITILVLISGYYIICTIVFYRKEVIAWLRGSTKSNPLPKEDEPPADRDNGDMLGKVRSAHDDSEEYVDPSDEIQFPRHSHHEPRPERNRDGSASMMGSLSDFLNEFKTLAQIISENNASRQDAEPMFKSMLEKYAGLRDTPFFEAINMHLHGACKETCEFDLHLNDVIAWWLPISK